MPGMPPREAFHQQTLSYKTYLLIAVPDSSFHTPPPPILHLWQRIKRRNRKQNTTLQPAFALA
ncbi:MAG: hypothetical protein HXL35_05470 [Prevotellaceae bacterium]|nr:hypothetical protein [Prevotellaceae bacterium]